jgi:hypothetical protein
VQIQVRANHGSRGPVGPQWGKLVLHVYILCIGKKSSPELAGRF